MDNVHVDVHTSRTTPRPPPPPSPTFPLPGAKKKHTHNLQNPTEMHKRHSTASEHHIYTIHPTIFKNTPKRTKFNTLSKNKKQKTSTCSDAADASLSILLLASDRSLAMSSRSTTVNTSPASGTPSNPPTYVWKPRKMVECVCVGGEAGSFT